MVRVVLGEVCGMYRNERVYLDIRISHLDISLTRTTQHLGKTHFTKSPGTRNYGGLSPIIVGLLSSRPNDAS